MIDQIKTDFEKIIKNSDLSESDIKLKRKYLNNFIENGFPGKKLENWKFLDLNQIISYTEGLIFECIETEMCIEMADFKGENEIEYSNIPSLCDKFNIKKNLINPIYIS